MSSRERIFTLVPFFSLQKLRNVDDGKLAACLCFSDLAPSSACLVMIPRGLGFSTRATLHQLEVSASKLVITQADMLLCNNKYKYL